MASSLSPPLPTDLLTGKELEKLSENVLESVRIREFKFIDPFPEEVQSECSICIMILKNPQIVTCCGNRFCEKCIGQVGYRSGVIGKCPLCKSQNIQYFPDKTLERQINQRKVYCLLRNDGCMWTGEVNKMSDHLDIHGLGNNAQPCLLFPRPCEYCGEYVRRNSMTAHKENCDFRPRTCKFCNEEVSKEHLKDHYKKCTSCPVCCTNVPCSEVMTRFILSYHLKKCKWSLMDCKFKHAGCNARIYRKDMDEHLQSNMEKHLDLVSLELEKQKLRQEILEDEKEDLFRTVLEKVDKLEEEIKDRGEIQFLVISNLPEDALYDELKLKSRFGQYGQVSDVYLLDSSLNAGIVVYSSDASYQQALDSSKYGIKLCKQLVKVTAVYTSDV